MGNDVLYYDVRNDNGSLKLTYTTYCSYYKGCKCVHMYFYSWESNQINNKTTYTYAHMHSNVWKDSHPHT